MSKDQCGPSKASPRSVRCEACGYDVPAAFQNADGSKARAVAKDVYGAGSLSNALGALLSLLIQDLPADHLAPCGLPCRPDAHGVHAFGTHPGAACAACAHISMSCTECASLASSILDVNTVWEGE